MIEPKWRNADNAYKQGEDAACCAVWRRVWCGVAWCVMGVVVGLSGGGDVVSWRGGGVA